MKEYDEFIKMAKAYEESPCKRFSKLNTTQEGEVSPFLTLVPDA